MVEGPNIVALRKALTSMADARGMSINAVDLEALARAAADATTWWDEVQLLNATGRGNARTLSDWCVKQGVPRHYMARRQDVVRALNAMPGRGRRTDVHEPETA